MVEFRTGVMIDRRKFEADERMAEFFGRVAHLLAQLAARLDEDGKLIRDKPPAHVLEPNVVEVTPRVEDDGKILFDLRSSIELDGGVIPVGDHQISPVPVIPVDDETTRTYLLDMGTNYLIKEDLGPDAAYFRMLARAGLADRVYVSPN